MSTSRSLLSLLVVSVCVSGLPWGGAPVAAQGGRPLFGAPGRVPADRVARGPRPRRSRIAALQLQALAAADGANPEPIVELNLFDDVQFVARVGRFEARGAGSFLWQGLLDGVTGHAAFVSTGGVVAGTVFADGVTYEVAYAGDGLYEVRELDPAAFPTDDPIAPGDLKLPADAAATPVPLTDSAALIDVLVVWTPAARAAAGGTNPLRSLVDLAVANANTAYANSGISTRLRLVYKGEVSYSETPANIGTDLTRLQAKADGYLDGVHTLRNQYGADVVTLIGSGYGASGACGIGYLMDSGSLGTTFEAYAFNVVDYSCAAGNLSYAHEVGHNEGMHHDPANASGPPAYAYSYGYVDPSCAFRTVMAYGSCTRATQFSSPTHWLGGRVTGTPAQDNARTLNETAVIVANFRQAVGSCSYTLSTAAAALPGAGGSSSLTVTVAGTGCAWTAVSNAPSWLTVTSGASGTTSGTVGFSATPNPSGSARSATLTIAGQAVTVTQAGRALTLLALQSSVSFPVTIGTPVTWTAVSVGGTSPEYRFLLYSQAAGWSVLRDWGAAATAAWTPAAAGTYSLQVWARNAGSSSAYDTWLGSPSFTITGIATTGVTLSSSRTFPIAAGTAVTWTAAGAGGRTPTQYAFWLRDANGWTLARPWAASNTFAWTPLAPGSYVVQAWARAAGSTAAYDAFAASGTLTVTPGPIAVLSIAADRLLPSAPGVAITWTAAASRGTTPLEYKFLRYLAGSGWSIVRDWSPAASATWTPGVEGSYGLQVWVRAAGSAAAFEAWGAAPAFTIASGPAVMASLTSTEPATLPVQTPITWRAEASGGTAALEYSFWRYAGGTWTNVQPYGPARTYTWTPGAPDAGACIVQAWVRSAGSVASYEGWLGTGWVTLVP